MAETQHLDDVLCRPLAQAAEVVTDFRLQGQRTRRRPFDRMSDPEPRAGRAEERLLAKAAVAQDAVTGLAASDLL